MSGASAPMPLGSQRHKLLGLGTPTSLRVLPDFLYQGAHTLAAAALYHAGAGGAVFAGHVWRGGLAGGGAVRLPCRCVRRSRLPAAYAIDTLLTSIMFCFVGYFNGCGKTAFVMIQGVVAAFLVRIPVSFLMSRLTPVSLFRVRLATPSSTAVQILLFLGYFLLAKKKK